MARARDIVHQHPGLTAQEIQHQDALELQQEDTPITNPQASLVATLHGRYQAHQLQRTRGRDGRHRLYPEGHQGACSPHHRATLPLHQGAECTGRPPECGGRTDLYPGQNQRIQTLSTLPHQDPQQVCADLIRIDLDRTAHDILNP